LTGTVPGNRGISEDCLEAPSEIEQSQMEMSPIAGDVVAWQQIQILENGDR